jgi:hypothetical protein
LLYTHLHINFHTNITLLWIHIWYSLVFLHFIYNKTKNRVTQIPPQTEGERRCSGRVCSYCSISDTCHVSLIRNPVISHEWGKDREVFTVSGTYPWSLVRYILSYIYNQKLSMSYYVEFVIVTICWADTNLNTNVKVGIIITRTLIWNNFKVFFPTIIAWNIILRVTTRNRHFSVITLFLVASELLIFLVFCVVFFVFFVFALSRVHPMLAVSLDCPLLIASLVLSDAYFMYKKPISKEIKIYRKFGIIFH